MINKMFGLLAVLGGTAIFLSMFYLSMEAGGTKYHYSVERHGRLVGHAVETSFTADQTDPYPRRMKRSIRFYVTLLDRDIDVRVDDEVSVNPESGRLQEYHSRITNGNMTKRVHVYVTDNEARFEGDTRSRIDLDEDTYFEQAPAFYRKLLDTFKDGVQEHDFKTVDTAEAKVITLTWRNLGESTLTLNGNRHDCLVLETYMAEPGGVFRYWIDKNTARTVKITLPGFTTVKAADKGIAEKIGRPNLDDLIIFPTNVPIGDIRALQSMRLKARILSQDPYLTPEKLNGPGQRFTGTVEDGLIEGVFELERLYYNGENAPAFPPVLSNKTREEMAPYLKAEFLIESENKEISEKARTITAGARDSWDAAKKISRWVSENIGYDLPGGSAKWTLATGKGECGSHALLFAALCRSVGIPARMVVGYMMTPESGGSFGQHGWNQVYMGEKAGWIPLDTTAREIDYVDAGHLALGSAPLFYPEELEILDYRAGAYNMATTGKLLPVETVPWQSGERLTWRILHREREVGSAWFQMVQRDNGDWSAEGKVILGEDHNYQSNWTYDADLRPLSFQTWGKRRAVSFSLSGEMTREGLYVTGKRAGRDYRRFVPEGQETVPLEMIQPGFYTLLAASLQDRTPTNLRAYLTPLAKTIAVSAESRAADTEETGARIIDLNIGTPILIHLDDKGRVTELRFLEENISAELTTRPEG
ncbi:MAG: transglutaminase-like domain-containing protein [Acidobacteriota bacterium]|nr:transglutaminase-like domain-containing protein [Acidobacteriota bacterium]